MKRYRKTTSALTSRSLYLRKRITGNRRRAKFVGFWYLLGTIALAAATCLPLLTHSLAPIGVTAFWKALMPANFNTSTLDDLVKTVNSAIYALVLLGVFINVIRAFKKLGWLGKKTANKTFGFNRNVYAMEDMGRIFSGSFAVVVIGHFLIAMLCRFDVKTDETSIFLLVALGVGVLIHLFAGFWGAKITYFDVENQEVLEVKRMVGRGAAVFRNILQLAAVFAIMYFLLVINVGLPIIASVLEKGAFNSLMNDGIKELLAIVLPLVSILCLLVLIKHATAITEFNFDGPYGSGMKNFRVFSLLIFILTGVAAFMVTEPTAESKLQMNLFIVAGIALAMFIIELLLRKRPKEIKAVKKAKKGAYRDEEMSFERFAQTTDLTMIDPVEVQEKPKKVKGKYQSKGQAQAAVQQPVVQASVYPQPYVLPPYYQPQAPVPFVVPAPVPVQEEVAAAPVQEEVKEEVVEKLSDEKQEVHCPYCDKLLRITAGIPYHCCPACEKIFPTRIKTRKKEN